MLLKVAEAHSSVLAQRAHVLGRNTNIGQVVVSATTIGEFYGVSSLSTAIEKAAMYLKVFPSSHNCLNYLYFPRLMTRSGKPSST